MESLPNSSSSNYLDRQASLDRLGTAAKDLHYVTSPAATETSLLEQPDEELAKYRTSGQILSCDNLNHKEGDPAILLHQDVANQPSSVEESKPRISSDELVPSIFMHPSMSEDDEAVCIIRMLQNSMNPSYRTTTSTYLPHYIPPATKHIRCEKPFFGFMSTPRINPANPEQIVAPGRPHGLVLTGRSLVWACAKSANLIPSEPQDVLIAFGIWTKVLNLLHRVRVSKSKPSQSSKNHHLRHYILELKDIERELNQVCPPGQVRPTVLGCGKYSFADYAISRVFELLLNDTSFFRLPYTRQKKYARIIEIASHVQFYRTRVTGAMVEDWRPPNVRPSNISTWAEIVMVKLDRELFMEQEGDPDAAYARAAAQFGETADTRTTSPMMCDVVSDDVESDFDTKSLDQAVWENRPPSNKCPYTSPTAHADYIRVIPRGAAPAEFIYYCHPKAPLRHFLYRFGQTVGNRQPTWHNVSEAPWFEVGKEKSQFNFLAVFTKPDHSDRCCWSLADMFAQKRLNHQDSLAESLAIEILEYYLEPEIRPIPDVLLTKFDVALQLEAQSRLLIPAIAIEQMKNFGQHISPSAYPRISQGIQDTTILNFIAKLS